MSLKDNRIAELTAEVQRKESEQKRKTSELVAELRRKENENAKIYEPLNELVYENYQQKTEMNKHKLQKKIKASMNELKRQQK